MAPVVKAELSERDGKSLLTGGQWEENGRCSGRGFQGCFQAARTCSWKWYMKKPSVFWPVPALQKRKQLTGWTLFSDYNRGTYGRKRAPIAAHLKNSSIFTRELSSWWPGAWSSGALGSKHSWGTVPCCVASAAISEWLEGGVIRSCNLISGWQRSINTPRSLAGDQG